MREYWTGDEADRLHREACEAEGVTETESIELETADRDELRRAVRQGGATLGATAEGVRRLLAMVDNI